ncbi:DnaJ domain-containing protein [Sphingomonas sp. CGMCC 1.13654]|uniref:DnaJ domain-containing protein n=1 Tax=Sphingomonas chungangi TaxID=2683589 RepID=A0A838L796_9SPHN|nr:DnaJ domain-containing protein [Sphingomonas chungangi]MVW57762.1 DnaJ domain-containing protein [Sphingomonas chungangi]
MKFLVALAVIAAIWWLGQRRKQAVLTSAEARDLLGVSTRAGEEEIRAAHRRLIGRVHPDAGGSDALARRVNAARDILVAELNQNRR